jgi:RNA polymerase sigma-70 factor, ECF subfamily
VSEDAPAIAAAELFRQHGQFVARFVIRYGVSLADIDDVVQEVFLIAHAHGGYRSGPAKPTSWLAAIAVRVATTHRRKLRTRAFARGNEELVDDACDLGPTPEVRVALDREMLRLHAALQSLPPEHRVTFILFELEGEPCGSIAAATGVPVGTVHSRLHIARRRLREALSRAASSANPAEIPWTNPGR